MKRFIALALCLILTLGCASAAFASQDKLSYVVLGDSIAYGSGLINSKEAVYGKIVADTNGYDYSNFAVPGHTTGAMLARLERGEVKAAVAGADIISVSIGGNNFLTNNIASFLVDGIVKNDYSRFDDVADDFYADLTTIMGKIRALNEDAAVLLQTIYNPQTGYVGEVYAQAVSRLNEKMREYAANNPGDIIIVDAASRLTNPSTDIAGDRIHPSVTGNEKLAVVVLETLKENGLGDSTTPVIKTKGLDVPGTGFFSIYVNIFGWMLHAVAVIRGFFTGIFG